jgi:hypothetical protein
LAWWRESPESAKIYAFRLDYTDVPVRMDSVACAQGQGRLEFFEDVIWKTTLWFQSQPNRGAALLWQLPPNGNLSPFLSGFPKQGRDSGGTHAVSQALWRWPPIWMRQTTRATLQAWREQNWGASNPLLQVLFWGELPSQPKDSNTMAWRPDWMAEHWFWDPNQGGFGSSARLLQIPLHRDQESKFWLANHPESSWFQGRGSEDSHIARMLSKNDLNNKALSKNWNRWLGGVEGASDSLPRAVQVLMYQSLVETSMTTDTLGSPLWASRALIVWNERGEWWLFVPDRPLQKGRCSQSQF